jgi:hypothetical protein
MENKKEQIENKRAKIIVSSEDELTDLLRKISGLTDPNILLTFAEESDLLISPINLKALQEVCDDLDKNLVLQIIQNSNGVRNAKIADSVITESPSEIDESLWLAAENGRRERKEKLSEALKGKPKEVRETVVELEQEIEPVLQDSEYQKRVQEVIEKAKNLTEKEKSQIIHEEGLTFAIGEEIAPEEQKKDLNEKKNLIGRNFNNIAQLKGLKGDIDKSIPEDKKKEQKIKPPKDKKKMKKKILIFSIILILSLALAGVFAYLTLPLVQTEIYIESKAIEVEKILKGDTKIENFDISKGDLPIKKESVNVDRSDHDKTTGTGKRGTKAEGIVSLQHWSGEETTIPAGTKISTDGLNFEFSTDVLLPDAPSTTQGIAVRATDPGSEYNLSSGQLLTVAGFSEDQLTAENKTSFSGGASEEYSMLTQADYTKLLERLKKEAFEDGIAQLKERNPEWELIESTIEQDTDGNITTDIPIGGEANLFNMSITTKTEALFFNKNEIIQSREEIIKRAAIEKKLFETDGDLRLELDQEIETEITIEEIEGNTVTVKFWAKGNVRPQVNTEEIEKSLLGKPWDEGMKILEKIKYSDKKASVNFFPEYFPEFLRHFPSKEGRVIVETKLIETEVVTESEEDLEEEEEIEEVEEE